MKKTDVVRIIGFAGTILGVAATLITNWSQQQTMEQTIEEKVNEAIAKREESE